MARIYGQDIRDKIIDILTNGSGSRPKLDTMLNTIDTARTQTTPDVGTITYDWGEFQDPIVRIDVKESDIIQDEELTSDFELTPESFTIDVMISIKSGNTEIHNYVENYIEAIERILNGYDDSDITWILAIGTDRSDLYEDEDQNFKFGLVQFQARIN